MGGLASDVRYGLRRRVSSPGFRGMRLVGAGLVAGGALAAVLARLVEGILYGVSASDPSSYLSAAAALGAAALLATVVPTLRTARLDPATAMRID